MQRDPTRKRDVLKRVIAYMTLGIDVSRLFPEMILSTNTSDILQKKMIYNFIVFYAEQRAELAIMTVNTLVKEACDNIDPMVRGLALKHLASLRWRRYGRPPRAQSLNLLPHCTQIGQNHRVRAAACTVAARGRQPVREEDCRDGSGENPPNGCQSGEVDGRHRREDAA